MGTAPEIAQNQGLLAPQLAVILGKTKHGQGKSFENRREAVKHRRGVWFPPLPCPACCNSGHGVPAMCADDREYPLRSRSLTQNVMDPFCAELVLYNVFHEGKLLSRTIVSLGEQGMAT